MTATPMLTACSQNPISNDAGRKLPPEQQDVDPGERPGYDRPHQHGWQNRPSLAAHEGDNRDGRDRGHPADQVQQCTEVRAFAERPLRLLLIQRDRSP